MKKANLVIIGSTVLALAWIIFNQAPEPPRVVLGSIVASSTTITVSGYRTVVVSANACETSFAAWGAGGGGATGATNQGGGGVGGGVAFHMFQQPHIRPS